MGLAAGEADIVVADIAVADIGAAVVVAADTAVVGDADDEENDDGKPSIS